MGNIRIAALVSIQCLTLLLTGCSEGNLLRNRAEDYKKEKPRARLEIPQGIAHEPFSTDYEIPIPEERLGQSR